MIKYVYASIDEKGKAKGGKKGDQTGKELKIRSPYDFGQDSVLRFKNRTLAKKAQCIILHIVKSRQCGYNQLERSTLFALAKSCKWDFEKFKKKLAKNKVNCDCSALIATVINLTFGVQKVPCFTTGTMFESYKKYLEDDFEYLIFSLTTKFKIGDILYKSYRHTVMVVKE